MVTNAGLCLYDSSWLYQLRLPAIAATDLQTETTGRGI